MMVLRMLGIVLCVVLLVFVVLTAFTLFAPARIEIKRDMPDGQLKVRLGFGPIKKVFRLGLILRFSSLCFLSASRAASASFAGEPQHFLYFKPLPHGHGSFGPIFLSLRIVTAFAVSGSSPPEVVEVTCATALR